MAEVFDEKASVFFVGGSGAKTGEAFSGGCTQAWYDANFTALSDIMGDDGAPLVSAANCNYDHTGAAEGEHKISKMGVGEFANAQVGMVAHISGTNITPGKYEITGVDETYGDYVLVAGIVATGDASDVTINIGGAFSSMAVALADTNAGSYNVTIHSNKDETAQTAISSGGSTANQSRLTVQSFSTVPGDGGATTLTYGSGVAVPITADRVTFDGFTVDGVDSGDHGITVAPGSVVYGVIVRNCTVRNANRGVYMGTNALGCHVDGCTFESSNSIAIYSLARRGSSVVNCFADMNGSGVTYATVIGYGTTFEWNIVHADGNYAMSLSSYGEGRVANNLFYGSAFACIYMTGSGDGSLIENNILHTEGNYAIYDSGRGISRASYNWTNASTPIYSETDAWDDTNLTGTAAALDLVNVAGDDFTPKAGSPVWFAGKPDANGEHTHIGPFAWPGPRGEHRSGVYAAERGVFL